MLKSIECVRFRGFKHLKTEVAPITAFLGPNSSGKTSMLHALRFACDALRSALIPESSGTSLGEGPGILISSELVANAATLSSSLEWQALFADQDVSEGSRLRVRLDFEESDPIQVVDVELTCEADQRLHRSVRVVSEQAFAEFPSPEGTARRWAFLREHAPIAVLVPPFYGTIQQEEYRSRAVVDRMLGTGDQSHVVRNLVVGLDSETFERLNGFLDEMVGARVTRRTSPDEVQRIPYLAVRFRDSNGDLELSAGGAGLVNLISLYCALSRWRSESARRRVLFLLDEPETHLHPRLQADMTERLGRLVTRDFGAQLLLATHSVDILNRLSASGALLIRCDRNATPSTVPLDSDAKLFDDLARWVDLTPFTAINFLASRRVAFCEGTDDIALLPRLAELRFRNDPARAARFRRWSLVPLNGASNAPIAGLLSRLVRSEVVRAQAQSGSFHVEVVLDRDHHRAPGTHEGVDEGVREVTTVWSRHSLESLMLDPIVLAVWIRAFAADAAPPGLPAVIDAALAAADGDADLNARAEEQLVAGLLRAELRDGAGRPIGGDARVVHAMREAKDLVAASPATWQRGKDRARRVLGQIREAIPLPARNRFPTDVIQLVLRAELNRIGDPFKAIPVEAGDLLDRWASP